MEITKAIDQIGQIHAHLTKAEVSRDYRAVPVACSGALALVAAVLESRIVPGASPREFVAYWVVVAVVGFLVAGGGIFHRYVTAADATARRRTRTVVGQLLPCLAAGIAVTAALTDRGPGAVALLPGLWAVLFSLGIFASRPYLPRVVGFVALFYLLAGALLLGLSGSGNGLSAGMGLTFGPGQILAGLVLYWNLERKQDG
jgi:hypothetical protein